MKARQESAQTLPPPTSRNPPPAQQHLPRPRSSRRLRNSSDARKLCLELRIQSWESAMGCWEAELLCLFLFIQSSSQSLKYSMFNKKEVCQMKFLFPATSVKYKHTETQPCQRARKPFYITISIYNSLLISFILKYKSKGEVSHSARGSFIQIHLCPHETLRLASYYIWNSEFITP